MNYEEYEPKVLQKLKEVEVEILIEISRVCEKNKITWFANGGTAIGAVRHQGFIPWDDDIDISMMRKDLDRFIEACKHDLDPRYELLAADGKNDFPCMVVQVIKKGTQNKPKNYKNLKSNFGIFVDIFPIDNVPKDETLRNKQIRDCWFWGKLLILRNIAMPSLPFYGTKEKLIKFICACIHYALVILCIPRSWIFKKCEEATLRYNDQDTGLMTCLCDTFPGNWLMTEEDIYPIQKMKFENIEINIQSENDKILRQVYGNYMELPPVEQRKNHPPYVLEFGDFDE